MNRRDNEIPQYVIDANKEAHAAIHAYLDEKGITSAPWSFYKLINVQYFPYDKVVQPGPAKPNGSLYTARSPYSAKNPAPSSFYQANIVVETNRALTFQWRTDRCGIRCEQRLQCKWFAA